MLFVFLRMCEEWSGLILLIRMTDVITISCVSLIQTGPSSPLCLNPKVFWAGTYSVGFSGSTCLFVNVGAICEVQEQCVPGEAQWNLNEGAKLIEATLMKEHSE